MYGDGTQTRSFCYVDDLVRGMMAMMATDDAMTGPINLGNPGEFSMLELAQAVIELTGAKSQVRFLPLPQDDPRQRQPDITKAREQLSWGVTIELREGLVKTIDISASCSARNRTRIFRCLGHRYGRSDRGWKACSAACRAHGPLRSYAEFSAIPGHDLAASGR